LRAIYKLQLLSRPFTTKSCIVERVRGPLIRTLLPAARLCDIKAACSKGHPKAAVSPQLAAWLTFLLLRM